MSRTSRARPRLGADFLKLFSAASVSTVGDGITAAAGPLLVASRTRDPALVAGAVLAQQLPSLLFTLIGGALADRLDRRRLIVAVHLLRCGAIGGLALAVTVHAAGLPLVYAALFLLGTGETVADTASGALVASVVPAEALPRANGRLTAVFYLGNQIGARPLGGLLFAVAAALPFGLDAATFAAAAVLVAAIRRPPAPLPDAPTAGGSSLRSEIAEGIRWLWRHPAMRMLTVCLCVMNVVFCLPFATYVLYARDRLGLGPTGFGLLVGAGAAGGVLGGLVAGRVMDRFGPAIPLRAGLLIEIATHLVLAATRSPWVAGGTMLVFGVHGAVWGVVAGTIRLRLTPPALRGRVTSVYLLVGTGGPAALGTVAGGALAHVTGVVVPFWLAGGAMAVLAAVAWRHFTRAALTAGVVRSSAG